MDDGYTGIRENLRSEDSRIYENIIDNTYETIEDSGYDWTLTLEQWNHLVTLEINLTVWNFCCVEVVNKQDLIRIIREGTDLEAECHSCQVDSLLWTYKPPNGSPADIVIGRELIRKNSPAENELWFNILINSTTCNYNLFIPSIQMKNG